MAENESDVATRAERYAERVRAELADLPPAQRTHLVDDLAAHLAETNDDGVPLLDQQGSPEQYAAELRSTLTATSGARGSSRPWWWAIAIGAAVIVVLTVAVLVVPRLAGSQGSTSPPTQMPTAQPSPGIEVPNLIGLSLAEATSSIENTGLSLGRVTLVASSSVPKGVVAAMSPASGSEAPSGTAVDITASDGPR